MISEKQRTEEDKGSIFWGPCWVSCRGRPNLQTVTSIGSGARRKGFGDLQTCVSRGGMTMARTGDDQKKVGGGMSSRMDGRKWYRHPIC